MTKTNLVVKEIIRKTPGGLHAWVRVVLPDGTEKVVKKEIKNLPDVKNENDKS